jgi:mannose/fructose/N-acetylgalactosamine-specific phosphotransferase system component IID
VAAYFVVDLLILVSLSDLACRHIAELDSGSGSDWPVVDSASFVESAVVGAYVVMEVVLVLAVVDVLAQAGHVTIQAFLDPVVPLVLALVLVHAVHLDLVQEASAFALDLVHVQMISEQSSYSAGSHLLDFP